MTIDPEGFEAVVLTKLSRIEGKLEAVKDHEKRIRFLERIAYGLGGVWILLAGWLKAHILSGK